MAFSNAAYRLSGCSATVQRGVHHRSNEDCSNNGDKSYAGERCISDKPSATHLWYELIFWTADKQNIHNRKDNSIRYARRKRQARGDESLRMGVRMVNLTEACSEP